VVSATVKPKLVTWSEVENKVKTRAIQLFGIKKLAESSIDKYNVKFVSSKVIIF
jgi:hypothetical protein